MTIENLNYLIALGTVALQVVTVLLLVLFLAKHEATQKLVEKVALPLAFLVALGGTAMTLVYSEYFGVIPCGLCWFQRIFLYPQIILLGIAMWRKDLTVAVYSVWLSVIGSAFALYHHFIQMGGESIIPCPASGAGDCAKRILFEFGYVTFPLAAFTAFWFIIVLMLFVSRRCRRGGM